MGIQEYARDPLLHNWKSIQVNSSDWSWSQSLHWWGRLYGVKIGLGLNSGVCNNSHHHQNYPNQEKLFWSLTQWIRLTQWIQLQGAWEQIGGAGRGWVKQDQGADRMCQTLPIQEVHIYRGQEPIRLYAWRICRVWLLFRHASVSRTYPCPI